MLKLPNINISLPEKVKEDLETMSKETGLSQAHLIRLATHSLLENYEMKGSFIFADLLNPNHKGGK